MTSNPEQLSPKSAAEIQRRLHPLSWLFVLLLQLKQFALPLIILLFTGRGDRYELWPLIGVAVLAVYSIFQYFTYHYRVFGNELIVRSGVFQKTVRHIPFSRIQNVSITQNILHQIFNVAEVKLEAAGGVTPEAQMRVLSLPDAQELEALIRSHANVASTATTVENSTSDTETLHRLSVIDVVKLGLINNRGMVLIGAAVGVVFQSGNDMMGDFIKTGFNFMFGWSDSLHLGATATAIR